MGKLIPKNPKVEHNKHQSLENTMNTVRGPHVRERGPPPYPPRHDSGKLPSQTLEEGTSKDLDLGPKIQGE